jgi:nonribosomal peptide synthetase protein BlmX
MPKKTRSAGVAAVSTERTIADLFTGQATRNPSAPAVRAGNQVWTYAELAARVHHVARFLTEQGIGRGSLVPLLFRPVPEALEAMLAVMQVGAAYVPLDPASPPQRLELALEEVRSPLLLAATARDVAERFPVVVGRPVSVGDIDGGGQPAEPVPGASDPHDLAYVIYTSGTTGRPNGVEVSHAALTNYLTWCANYYPLQANAGGSLVHTSIGFDLTVTSLFAPLLCGQPVQFLSGGAGDIDSLAAALRALSAPLAFLKMTPSHLRALRHLLSPADLARATGCLILGGEPLHGEDLAGFEASAGHLRIFNEYGPTEATVGCTCYEVVDLPRTGPIPIGTPIDNTTVYVCDEEQRVLPAGVTGELCIAGRGLARGYHDRDELTARKFVPLAVPTIDRVYRTGDLARVDEDGRLVFLGRLDQQVKLRGHRIELEEIESALRRHEAVAEAVVVLDTSPESARLVAFIVPDVSRREAQSAAGRIVRHAITPSELYAYLRRSLPDYMLPSRFVLLDAVPTTGHGKVDRRALLGLASDAGASGEYVPARTDMEAALAAVFAKVLKVDPPGIDDNYFALGGDSIRSIQVAGEAQLRGLSVSVGDLHRFPTIRALAEQLAARHPSIPVPRTQPFDLVSAEDRSRMPADAEDAYPLNLLQEGMIYHRAFAAKSAVYHAMLSLVLKAPFDLSALLVAVQDLLNRHPLLRTSFDQKTFSIPLQLVHRTVSDPLRFVDLQGLPVEEQQASIDAWIQAEKARGFDVDEYPLIRFMVHRLAEDRFRLTFSYHHEIIDGWSESTMVTELLTQYLSAVNGEPIEMTPPDASFRDAVRLEQMALQSDEFKSFWERALEGASFMRLPRLLSGPQADKGQRAIVKLHVPFAKEPSDGLKRVALALGVPLKSVLLAGHMKVMGLFGGSRDVLTHTVSNGRPESIDGAGLIGLFVNSFTFRQKLTHASWRDLILETLRLEQASIPYRRYPMAELRRHQGRDGLSETLFFLIDYHVYHRLERWKNAKLLHYEVYGESTFPFCATFRVNHVTSELDMQIEYDSLQFPPELIDGIIDAYRRVYGAILADPSERHHLFSLPAPSAESRVVQTLPAPSACIHQWIEQASRRTPDAAAIVCGDATVSFRALNARANRLARWLIARGIGPESRVGLFLERSPDLIVAMLATLKAGACYVPLDPEHHSDRINAILAAAAPSLVWTRGPLMTTLAAGSADVWTFDRAWDEARALDGQDVAAAVAPENLAYIIFTSGSTGAPKGVMVPHAALVASTAARLAYYDREPSQFLLLSSAAFDSSVAGIYWTLCAGRTLVLPEASVAFDLDSVLALTRRQGITHTLCIPSFYASMLESARGPELASLETVIVAGEECRSDVWELHKAKVSAVTFYNEYGPSEATVWSTVWKGDPHVSRASLPIGKPIATVRAHILDADRHEVPVGVMGELNLGGANLARGYFGDPVGTAARYVPNPLAPDAGARLYRSGDLARLTREGNFEYAGRQDHQIKVRGFRIEPAEIEAVLETHPLVKRAVVVPREDQAGERVLVAYAVPGAPGALASPELLAFAKDKLPKFMVPASVVVVEALPLTATGKVDRNALPTAPVRPAGATPTPPRTPTEEAIAGIWARVLGVDRIGVFDDFLDLGGESLRAMRVLSQIRKAFDVELPIASLIHTQGTVAALADAVDAALWMRLRPLESVASSGVEDAIV